MGSTLKTVLGAAVAWALSTQLNAQTTTTQFDFPSQPLAESLKALASTADVNVLFDTQEISTRVAPAFRGHATVDQALSALLDSSGLQARYLDGKTVVLEKAARKNFKSASFATDNGTGASNIMFQFDIQEKPLAEALMDLSAQSGLTVIAPSLLTEGKNGAQVRGDMSAEDAVRSLLRGSGLTFIRWEDGTIAIQAQAAALRFGSEGLAQVNDGRSSLNEDSPESPRLEEIIVTAQKREERLQDVPISISILTGEDLDSSTVQGVQEALRNVPGVASFVTEQGGGTRLTVRGVGAASPFFNGTSPVGFYLDGVPFGLVKSAILPDANGYDLDRVEVLRGPQGTLYGANAQNGVVRVLTKDPDPSRFEMKARTAGSGTQHGGANYRGDLALNVPIVEGKFAARAVMGYQDLSGWIDRPNRDDANDSRTLTGRIKLLAQPTDQFSIGLSAWLSRNDDGAPSTSSSADNKRSPFLDESMETDYDVFGLNLGYDFSNFSLVSVTSYIDYVNRGFLDFNNLAPLFGLTSLYLETLNETDVFTQEFNLSSNLQGPWRWTAGGIYREGKSHLYQLFGPITPVPNDYVDTSESFAVFGELTRAFFDGRLELTGGLRYFEDTVTTRELSNLDGRGQLINLDNDFQKLSPRAVLTWHQNSNLTTYVSYSEGFRSGFNQGVVVLSNHPEFPPAEADNLKNYELGAKGSLWDGRMTFDTAFFYVDWQDVQQPLTILYGPSSVAATVNGESASGMGFEFATTAKLAKGLTVGMTFGWNDLANDENVITRAGNPPRDTILFPKDSRLNTSPEYTASASADYAFPLGGTGYDGRISASAFYTAPLSSYSLDANNSFRKTVGGTLLISRAQLAIDFSDQWTATLYADNVGNEQGTYAIGISDQSIRPRPRTIGLQLEFHL